MPFGFKEDRHDTGTQEQRGNVFRVGAMARHALTHAVLAAIKSEEPHKSLGIRMTPAANTVAAVLWAGVSVALARYAWSPRRSLPSA